MRFVSAADSGVDNESAANVVRVHFEGVERTKDWAMKTETKDLFKVKTFRELIVKAYETKLQMEKDGLFEQVVVLVDVDRSENPTGDGYEITFVAREPARHKAYVGMDISNRGEGSVRGDYKGFSIFGGGESGGVSISQGNERTTSFHFGMQKPLLKWRDARLGLNLFRVVAEYPWSGFMQVENAAALEFKHEPLKNVMHQLSYLASWRRVDITQRAAFAIREHAGHSFKSSVQSVLAYDTQDDPILATRGILARVTNELAGMGGDAKFSKHDLDLKLSTTLPFNIVLSAGGQFSYVRPRAGPMLSIVDRTFLGGAVNLRGFGYNAVGPISENCYLGGMSSWCGALHFYRRLWPSFLYAHGFATCGNIHPVSPGAQISDVIREMTVRPRFSVGAGLLVKLGQRARLEFNYCLPFTSHSTDGLNQGFQFGVGVNFV